MPTPGFFEMHVIKVKYGMPIKRRTLKKAHFMSPESFINDLNNIDVELQHKS